MGKHNHSSTMILHNALTDADSMTGLTEPEVLRRQTQEGYNEMPNFAFWWVIGGALIFLLLVLYIPFLRQLFSFSLLHPIDIAICIGGGIVSLLWFEQLKCLNYPK